MSVACIRLLAAPAARGEHTELLHWKPRHCGAPRALLQARLSRVFRDLQQGLISALHCLTPSGCPSRGRSCPGSGEEILAQGPGAGCAENTAPGTRAGGLCPVWLRDNAPSQKDASVGKGLNRAVQEGSAAPLRARPTAGSASQEEGKLEKAQRRSQGPTKGSEERLLMERNSWDIVNASQKKRLKG